MPRDEYRETLLLFSSLLIEALNQIVIHAPDLSYYMKNSDLKISHDLFISNKFVDDKTYRVKNGKSVCVKKEFEGNILLNRIYKPGSSDMDYLLDDATAKQYLFALFKLFKSGSLEDRFAKPIKALHLDDSFESIVDQYLNGETVEVSPDILTNFRRQMIIATLSLVGNKDSNDLFEKTSAELIPTFESGDDKLINNFIAFMKKIRTDQLEKAQASDITTTQESK